MSRFFGPMRQLGYVVDDLDSAIAWWVDEAGIGPWFALDPRPLSGLIFRGALLPPINVSAAFANSGDMQIELIQQHDATCSLYRTVELASPRPTGGCLHHWSSWPDRDDYQRIRTWAVAAGYVIEMEADPNAAAFLYLSRNGRAEPYIEMAAALPWRTAFFDKVRLAAIDWDGRNPVRDLQGAPR